MPKTIYLDNHSTASPSLTVLDAMEPYLRDKWGVLSAPHLKGQELTVAVREAYSTIYCALGMKEEDCFVLTSSGTEAVNHVMQSVFYDITRQSGKNHFLSSVIDEAPAIMAMGRLESQGASVGMISVDGQGVVSAAAVADELSPRTVLVSLSWADGLTGVVHPVQEIIELCHSRGIAVHIDATHVIGKLYVDLTELGADFITFDAEQIHGPRACGGLVIRGSKRLSPFLVGGSEQGGMRAGALPVAGLVGLALALEEARSHLDYVSLELARLRAGFEQGLCERLVSVQAVFSQSERLPNCSAYLFPGVCNDALLYSLAQQGLCASFGGGKFQRIALVLEAAGIDPELACTALSFALSRQTTEEELQQAVELIAHEYQRLRAMSEQIIPQGKIEVTSC